MRKKKTKKIMIRLVLVLWITAITSALISEADRADENEGFGAILGFISYEDDVNCWSDEGGDNYVTSGYCDGVFSIELYAEPAEKILSTVAGHLGDHLREYVPKIELDTDTISSIEALRNKGRQFLDEGVVDVGFQESVFMAGSLRIDWSCDIDSYVFNDGAFDKYIWCNGDSANGMSVKPDESAVKAFTAGTRHASRHNNNNNKRNHSRMRPNSFAAIGDEKEERTPSSKFVRGRGRGEKDTRRRMVKSGPATKDKVMVCDVGFKGQTAWVECEGTFKMEFGMDTTTDSMVQSLTDRLDKHLEEYLPKRIPFGKDVRKAIEGLENVGQGKVDVDDDDIAKETTILFGGQWAVNFGCRMVLSEGDKPTLSVQCGGRGVGGIGIFPPHDDNEL